MADKAYDYQHQQTRARLLPKAYGTPCPLCGLPMLRTQLLDLDHSTAVVLGGTRGDRIVHALKRDCPAGGNRSQGAALGNRLRGRRGSQDW